MCSMLNNAYMTKINNTVLGLVVICFWGFIASGCANNATNNATAKKVTASKVKKPEKKQQIVVVNKARKTAGASAEKSQNQAKDQHHVAYDKKRMWYNQQWLAKQEAEERQRIQRQKYKQKYEQNLKKQARLQQVQQRNQQQQVALKQQYHNRYKQRQAQIEARQQQNNWQRNQAGGNYRASQNRQYTRSAGQNNVNLAHHLSNAAIARTRHRIRYDGRYIPISYPMGDVPANMGVCTDVVVRSYRRLGIDLQRLVHEDMSRAFYAYPNLSKWRLTAPDPNIDHRRVHNLRAFFTRNGQRLPVTNNPRDYRPGDLVTWSLGGDQGHIGIVVNRRSPVDPNRYMIVHNIAHGTKMEDVLFNWPITGHFRYFPNRQPWLASAR